MDFKRFITDVKDYPKEGIIFKDLTTLWKDASAFRECIHQLAAYYKNKKIDKIVAAEARGFIIGAPLAYELKAGFVPVRKPKKLPRETITATYELEYGTDTLAMHKDAIQPGEKVLIVDDLIATGGTCKAILHMVEQLGGTAVGFGFLVELSFLNGRNLLAGHEVYSLIRY